MFFFFSSRRRHTRYIGDWSSDVCSSDLFLEAAHLVDAVVARAVDLLDVHIRAGGNFLAGCTHLARCGGRSFRCPVGADAVEALREEARARGLADRKSVV